MPQINFADSQYRFTDPVRYFKKNDPYYWEVDNIPIKQLEENSLWLKDQVQAILEGQRSITITVDRDEFNELRPYVNGSDNIVHVKPGRYTARINDAYKLEPLQNLTRLLGEDLGDINAWQAVTINNTLISAAMDRLQGTGAANALGMTGLEMRTFSHPMMDPENLSPFLSGDEPSINTLTGIDRPPFPLSQLTGWVGDDTDTTFVVKQYDTGNPTIGFASLALAESQFVKRWRGVARTSIVDIPSELTIEVPAFNADDHFYIDSDGTRQSIAATQRIDLLFCYSKPVDTSATYIAKFVDGSPTQITAPQLGLVVGAGVGADFSEGTRNIEANLNPVSGIDVAGTSKMLAAAGDESGANMGFTGLGVVGSFPSPDDLMNLTPALLEELSDDNIALVGQSVMPIAYVVVKQSASTNPTGANVITSDDLIDIRPLLRTTELSYNERAGIAAAQPAPSLANPVVTEAQMDFELNRLIADYRARIDALQPTTTGGSQAPTTPRTVGTGYVKGGANFGPEGALMHLIQQRFLTGASTARLKQEFVARAGLPSNFVVPDIPDWDISTWSLRQGLANRGTYPNDCIYTNVHEKRRVGSEYGCWENNTTNTRLSKLGTDGLGTNRGYTQIYYVKKTINLNRQEVPWMGDYHVNVSLWNCIPLSTRVMSSQSTAAAGSAGIWVSKKENQFTIHVAWVAVDFLAGPSFPPGQQGSEGWTIPGVQVGESFPHLSRNGGYFAGFTVINSDVIAAERNLNFTGEHVSVLSVLPSVEFEVIGIPDGFIGHGVDLSPNGVTLNLR